jgi:hypothetical protein
MRAFAIASLAMVGFAVWGPASAQVYWGDRGGWSGNRSGGWVGTIAGQEAGIGVISIATAIFSSRSLVTTTVAKRLPRITRKPRRRANWTPRRATRSS